MSESSVKLPNTTSQQRQHFYLDVDSMLSPGFLTLPVQIGDLRLTIRSPSPGDLYLIRHRAREGSDSEWVCWSLATCTWMMDGYVLDDVNSAVDLYHVYRKLPDFGLSKMFAVFLGLFNQSRSAIEDTYHFCLEHSSRLRWFQMNGKLPNERGVTGICGSEQVGMNMAQKIWVAYNQIEDRKELDEREWQRAKFIASTQAPKYVRQLNTQEQAAQDRKNQEQQQELDTFYYRKIGVLDANDRLEDGREMMQVQTAKSPAQLDEEYWRWVHGEMDEHDKVVEDYKKRIRETAMRRKEEHEQRMADLEAELRTQREEVWEEEAEVEFFTPEEIQDRLKGRPRGRRVYDDSLVQAREHVLKTHLEAQEVAPSPGMTFDEKTGTWKEPSKTLNESLRGRKPTLHTTGS